MSAKRMGYLSTGSGACSGMLTLIFFVSCEVLVASAPSPSGSAAPASGSSEKQILALRERAFTAVALRRHSDALRDFDAILRQSHSDIEALWCRADMLEALGRLGEAETAARRAFVAAPQHADVLRTLGWILARRGKFEEGIRHLRSSHSLALTQKAGKKELSQVTYALAVALMKGGHLPDARQVLDATYRQCDDCRGELEEVEGWVTAGLRETKKATRRPSSTRKSR